MDCSLCRKEEHFAVGSFHRHKVRFIHYWFGHSAQGTAFCVWRAVQIHQHGNQDQGHARKIQSKDPYLVTPRGQIRLHIHKQKRDQNQQEKRQLEPGQRTQRTGRVEEKGRSLSAPGSAAPINQSGVRRVSKYGKPWGP